MATITPEATCLCHRRDRGCYIHGPQPRERLVECQYCRRLTMAVNPVCDDCAAEGFLPGR
jgi:hypothetical protein